MASEESEKLRIVVVDDEKMLLNVFSSMMHQCHYHADFFSNPLKAFDAILEKPGRYQLMILDIHMPQMDGITFAKKIRTFLPDIPILFMTAEVSDEIRQEALVLGRVEFLEKPFPLEATLKEVIPKLLGISTSSSGSKQ